MTAKPTRKQPKRSVRVSIYTGEPGLRNLPRCATVGALIHVLQQLPEDLPISDDAQFPMWFNVGSKHYGSNGEHLGFESEDWMVT